MNLERVIPHGVTYAGRDDKHVAHVLSGIDDRPPWGGAGRVVVLSGSEAAQKGVA